MIKKSPFWRSMYSAWELTCDYALPRFCRPAMAAEGQRKEDGFNPLYVLPLWGAVGGLTALLIGKILGALLPVNGTALLFAGIFLLFSELRTGFRGLALNVTFWENIFAGNNIIQAQNHRQDSLRSVNGIVPLLLAIALLGGKFMLIVLAARSGCFGIAGAAWVAALTAEAVMAAEPEAVKVPGYCREARAEYIMMLGGFLLLFNLVSLPLPTLIATAAAAVITIAGINTLLRKTGVVTSNDITMTGYLVELTVWLCMGIMIG